MCKTYSHAIDCDACRGLQQHARWRQLDVGELQEPGKGLLVRQLVASDLLPQDVCTFGDQEFGAISFARSRSLKACGVPSSSTTHLMEMLASMTSVFTVRRAPRGAG